MTFDDFLGRHAARTSLLMELREDPVWPGESERLEDFEGFVRAHVEEEPAAAVAELRAYWRVFADFGAEPSVKHHLDLALAAWRDYAAHLRGCSHAPADGCEVAEELLDQAVEASDFAELEVGAASC